MRISREWLQSYFEHPLPDIQTLADALTFHAFEIESTEGDILDVKVTPNRGHDCLSHRGIAKELSAILNIALKSDPLRKGISLPPHTGTVAVSIEHPDLCARYIACLITGVKVGPSPEWLRKRLEAVGQKSINNIVDATNYVMFDIGQPLHAFDAAKLKKEQGTWRIEVRRAKEGETMLALDDKEYALRPENLVISDLNAWVPIGIAGVKGGKASGIDENTTDIILESANFNGVSVRKTAQALKLRTDASDRFQQVLSPELAAYGMKAAAELIVELAGGEIVGTNDAYPVPQEKKTPSVSAEKINQVLGTQLKEADIASVLERLGIPFEKAHGTFVTRPPFERLDLSIAEDLIEEVGRIVGYDAVPETNLSHVSDVHDADTNLYWSDRVREELVSKGYSEVFTSVFAEEGEIAVLNKVGGERPYLRKSLIPGLQDAFQKNKLNADLLGLKEIRLCEIGTVWREGKEVIMVGMVDGSGVVKEESLGEYIQRNTLEEKDSFPTSSTMQYKPFSKFPYIVRDVALWVPHGIQPEAVRALIFEKAGELAVRIELFDTFEKDGKTSLAFRIIFQSFDRTLTDEEANNAMKRVYEALEASGYEIR